MVTIYVPSRGRKEMHGTENVLFEVGIFIGVEPQ